MNKDTATLQRIDAFQRECLKQGLPLESQMASVLRRVIKFIDAFDIGPRASWSCQYDGMRQECKTLRSALKAEFPEILEEKQIADIPPNYCEFSVKCDGCGALWTTHYPKSIGILVKVSCTCGKECVAERREAAHVSNA
jgi:hypothetical protein